MWWAPKEAQSGPVFRGRAKLNGQTAIACPCACYMIGDGILGAQLCRLLMWSTEDIAEPSQEAVALPGAVALQACVLRNSNAQFEYKACFKHHSKKNIIAIIAQVIAIVPREAQLTACKQLATQSRESMFQAGSISFKGLRTVMLGTFFRACWRPHEVLPHWPLDLRQVPRNTMRLHRHRRP